jgi:biopolymer transport protein ExbB
VEHLGEPRELIEEIMYETVLTTRLKVNRLLPFIAICAASAPLLGLLGTVTGIINTFKIITEFGTGDVKNLSGGISEALITTKFGLIVAIPSLLLHAFLSRKARNVIGEMERAAVAFVNQVSRTPTDELAEAVPEAAREAAVVASEERPGAEIASAVATENRGMFTNLSRQRAGEAGA